MRYYLTCIFAVVLTLIGILIPTRALSSGVLLLALISLAAGVSLAFAIMVWPSTRSTMGQTKGQTKGHSSKRSKGHTKPWGNAWAQLRHNDSKGYRGQPIQGALGHPRG